MRKGEREREKNLTQKNINLIEFQKATQLIKKKKAKIKLNYMFVF